jgi:phosphatidylglycerophosphate synthase
MSKNNIKDIKLACNKKENDYNSFLIGILRPFSYYPTKIFVGLGFSPNGITYLNYVVVILAMYLFLTINEGLIYFAVLLLFLWQLLDIIDGNIARYQKKTSKKGAFIDHMLGIILLSILYPVLGFRCLNDEVTLFILDEKSILILSFLTSILAILSRLTMFYVEDIFSKNVLKRFKYDNLGKLEKNFFTNKILIIARNIEMLGGLQLFILLFFSLIFKIEIFIFLYFIINFFIFFLIYLKPILKN